MSPDRPKFTFWPDPREAKYIATHSPRDISMFMHDYPDLFTAYLHELWRIDQVEKMYESVKLLLTSYNTRPLELLFKNGTLPLKFMCLVHNVPVDEASNFLREAMEITYKVENDFGFHDPLLPHIKDSIEKGVAFIIEPIKSMVQEKKARLN